MNALLQQWLAGARGALSLGGWPAEALAIVSLMLFLWRFVRFTLSPILHPEQPKEYPYWLPGVGHLGSFLSNAQTLLTESR